MKKIIERREPDGSVHYSHCHSEDLPTHPCFERRLRARWVHPTRPLRRTRLFGAALALAGTMFWCTMLISPPISKAALSGPEPNALCTDAGLKLGVWFETELHRRAWAVTGGYDHYNLMVAWRNTAISQCASGMVARSAENFRAIEAMIAALDERRSATGDRD